jgi:hypothetical protein
MSYSIHSTNFENCRSASRKSDGGAEAGTCVGTSRHRYSSMSGNIVVLVERLLILTKYKWKCVVFTVDCAKMHLAMSWLLVPWLAAANNLHICAAAEIKLLTSAETHAELLGSNMQHNMQHNMRAIRFTSARVLCVKFCTKSTQVQAGSRLYKSIDPIFLRFSLSNKTVNVTNWRWI